MLTRLEITVWARRLYRAHGGGTRRTYRKWKAAIQKQLTYDTDRGVIADCREVIDSCRNDAGFKE